jgi:hypothetical protein
MPKSWKRPQTGKNSSGNIFIKTQRGLVQLMARFSRVCSSTFGGIKDVVEEQAQNPVAQTIGSAALLWVLKDPILGVTWGAYSNVLTALESVGVDFGSKDTPRRRGVSSGNPLQRALTSVFSGFSRPFSGKAKHEIDLVSLEAVQRRSSVFGRILNSFSNKQRM